MSPLGLPLLAPAAASAEIADHVASDEAALLSIGEECPQAPARAFDHRRRSASGAQLILEGADQRCSESGQQRAAEYWLYVQFEVLIVLIDRSLLQFRRH